MLGGLRLEVRPLKLGQLRHVLDALEEMAGKSGGGLIEAAAHVVAAGLAPAHPELTAERVLDLEASIEQLNDAVAADSAHRRAAPAGQMAPERSHGGSAAGGELRGRFRGSPREQLAAIYGALATGCGYPYPVIDGMTLAEAGEIFAYWEHDPPAHLIVQTIARLLGWTRSASRCFPATPRIDELAASPPPGLAVAHGGAIGMPAPVLDPEVLRARNQARAAEIARRASRGRRTAIVAHARRRLTCRGTSSGRVGCGGAGSSVPLVP